MTQYSFEFDFGKNFEVENFLVSPSNEKIYNYLSQWPEGWNGGRYSNIVFLFGKKFSGKTHLAKIWQDQTKAALLDFQLINEELAENDTAIDKIISEFKEKESFIIENLLPNSFNENFLLHLINLCVEEKKFLLITSEFPLSQFNFKLPDLESRMKSLMHFEIEEPDSELMQSILFKRFSDLNLRVGNDVVNFLLTRMERSFQAIENVVMKINMAAMNEKRAVTIPFVKSILEPMQEV